MTGPLIFIFILLLFSSLSLIIILLKFPSKILLGFSLIQHIFILLELLFIYFFVSVTIYSGFLLRILIMLLEVFLFFLIFSVPSNFFFVCLRFGQCSHISSFLNLRVLKLKNISQ